MHGTDSAVTQRRGVQDLVRVDGDELQRLRIARGLAQEAVAARAAVSVSTVQRAECGHEISQKSAHRIAGALQLPVTDIVARRASP